MECTVEEVEIKIEYNESFDSDPLHDRNVYCLQSNVDIRSDCVLDENKPSKRKYASDSDAGSSDKLLHTCNKYFDDCTEKEVSWYKSIDDSGRFLCKFCDLKYSTLQTLRYHVKNKHPERAKFIKENLVQCKRRRKLKCHICKQRFKETSTLKNHVNNFHLLNNIKTSCVYCDAAFVTENEMTEHLYMQHKKVTYKTTHVCNICGYRTSIKSHYKQHKNTHLPVKTKKCNYCTYATNYLPNLKIHERIHTNDMLYVCDFTDCKYRCSAKSAFRSHQLKHYPDGKILYCDKCSYKTIYRQSLNRHEDCHRRNSIKLKLT